MDNAATTPLRDCAYETMKYALYSRYQNPSSAYSGAKENKKTLESCRCQIAELINADPTEIYFTSGGTEADNWALKGIKINSGDNIVTTKVEHDAVYRTAGDIEAEVRYTSPDINGRVNFEDIMKQVDDHTKLVSCMTINNETGTTMPIITLGKALRERGVVFHTDAVQAFGHTPIDVVKMNIDMLSASAHKFGGPKGIGFLYARHMTKLSKIIQGGHQERDMRAGTENLPAIMGMAAAAKEAVKNMSESYKSIEEISAYLTDRIITEIDFAKYNGSGMFHYPGIINFSFIGVPGEQLVEFMNQNKICISSGSACNTDSNLPSRVLMAMGRSEDEANCAVRFSLSENNTMEEAARVIEVLKKGVNLIRG